jgi:hypothetical protein
MPLPEGVAVLVFFSQVPEAEEAGEDHDESQDEGDLKGEQGEVGHATNVRVFRQVGDGGFAGFERGLEVCAGDIELLDDGGVGCRQELDFKRVRVTGFGKGARGAGEDTAFNS